MPLKWPLFPKPQTLDITITKPAGNWTVQKARANFFLPAMRPFLISYFSFYPCTLTFAAQIFNPHLNNTGIWLTLGKSNRLSVP